MLGLDDYSRQPRAPVQPEAKPLPDDHTLTLDDETKRAPAPVQGTRDWTKIYMFKHVHLSLISEV